MLRIEDREYFRAVVETAADLDALGPLLHGLRYLARYGGADGTRTRCRLYRDHAPLSFFFQMESLAPTGEYAPWFIGGLIYSGPGQPLDGSAPAYVVALSPVTGPHWSVHT